MIYTAMTKKAIKLMYEKHKDQVDKSNIPYVLHPIHVAEQMADEYRTVVALLHDIVEDTDVTLEQLDMMGFPQEVLDALRVLTHSSGVDYFKYIEEIGTNEIAIDVKLADLEHNSDLSRLDEITEKDIARVEKYKKSMAYLKKIKNR